MSIEDGLPAPDIHPLGDYLDTELDDTPLLVQPGLIARAGITVTLGRGGKGKTTLNINRLLRWAVGKPLFDEVEAMTPVEPLRSLIVENEGAAHYFQGSLATILSHYTPEDRALARENVWVWGDGAWTGLKLDNADHQGEIRRALEVSNADILFIEPMRGLWRGDENSSQEMARLVDALSGIADDYQCAVLMAHHERKGGAGEDGEAMSAARGSSVLEGAAAVMERFQGVGGDNTLRELSWTKARFYGAPEPVRMKWNPERYGYDYVPTDLDDLVLHFLRKHPGQAFSVDMLMEHFEESRRTVQRACKRLAEGDKIKSAAGANNRLMYRAPTSEDNGGLDI